MVTISEQDKIMGVLNLILDEQDKRKEEFIEYNGSFEYYNKVSKVKKPLIAVIINNIEIFIMHIFFTKDIYNLSTNRHLVISLIYLSQYMQKNYLLVLDIENPLYFFIFLFPFKITIKN